MARYYFTFGLGDDQAHKGGWVAVDAMDMLAAIEAFRIYYPDKDCFSNVYDAARFQTTRMWKNGNFGKYCWYVIKISREKTNDSEGDHKPWSESFF